MVLVSCMDTQSIEVDYTCTVSAWYNQQDEGQSQYHDNDGRLSGIQHFPFEGNRRKCIRQASHSLHEGTAPLVLVEMTKRTEPI